MSISDDIKDDLDWADNFNGNESCPETIIRVKRLADAARNKYGIKNTHSFGPSGATSKGSGHSVMFGYPSPAKHFDDFPEGGGYPKGFLEWAFQIMRCEDYSKVLHLCAGSVKTGVRVDIRPEKKPDIIADCRNVPLPDCSFDFILADPPYSEEYAANLYGTAENYPLPGQIVKEAARLLRPDGLFGLMHFQVPFPSKGMKILGVYGISQGCGYAIKAWTLMKKPSAELFDSPSDSSKV